MNRNQCPFEQEMMAFELMNRLVVAMILMLMCGGLKFFKGGQCRKKGARFHGEIDAIRFSNIARYDLPAERGIEPFDPSLIVVSLVIDTR